MNSYLMHSLVFLKHSACGNSNRLQMMNAVMISIWNMKSVTNTQATITVEYNCFRIFLWTPYFEYLNLQSLLNILQHGYLLSVFRRGTSYAFSYDIFKAHSMLPIVMALPLWFWYWAGVLDLIVCKNILVAFDWRTRRRCVYLKLITKLSPTIHLQCITQRYTMPERETDWEGRRLISGTWSIGYLMPWLAIFEGTSS